MHWALIAMPCMPTIAYMAAFYANETELWNIKEKKLNKEDVATVHTRVAAGRNYLLLPFFVIFCVAIFEIRQTIDRFLLF